MSDNGIVIKGRNSLPMGAERWEIRDYGMPVQFVDLITELLQLNGVVHIALASTIIDAGNSPFATIAARFRMDRVTAQSLHKYLGDAISDALKPVDKPQAN
ncbi:hypothetical protein GOZ89_09685 [Agrobacterium vitis]|uniref:hypothetical protein n=1 Tax=Agrobacterium vitis TaxID=373 RepID=UPI0012E6F55B|nr:hypothetical protein [Agrobacterium vitis]MCF1468468.1 hypothetical protein [Agrobacterium vitis]MVA79688.1 hypothetical protein [Agrobacterium vitis]